MDLAHAEELMKQGAKMLLLCNPHNPGGRVWEREELVALGELCLKNEGSIYGQGGEGFLRINLACPRSIVVEAMDRFHRAIRNMYLLAIVARVGEIAMGFSRFTVVPCMNMGLY